MECCKNLSCAEKVGILAVLWLLLLLTGSLFVCLKQNQQYLDIKQANCTEEHES